MFQDHALGKYTPVPGHHHGSVSATAKDQSIKLSADETIYSEGEYAVAIYQVEAGVVRIYRLSSNGQRHILTICGKGEWFGHENGNVRTDIA